MKNATITAGIGILFDKSLDLLRVKPEFNNFKYTHHRNLSYKPKEALKFQTLNLNYERKFGVFNLANPTGAGIVENVAVTLVGNKVIQASTEKK